MTVSSFLTYGSLEPASPGPVCSRSFRYTVGIRYDLWASSALSSSSARHCPQTHGAWLCHRRQLVVPCTEIEQARCQTKLGLFAGPFCFVCNNIIFGRTQGRFLAGDTALADRLAATIHLVPQRQNSIRRPQRNIRGHNIPVVVSHASYRPNLRTIAMDLASKFYELVAGEMESRWQWTVPNLPVLIS